MTFVPKMEVASPFDQLTHPLFIINRNSNEKKMKRASSMHIDNSSPTCLIRVVHVYWWGGEFSSRMFFPSFVIVSFAWIILGQCRGINFFKATRSEMNFFNKVFPYANIYFCIWSRLGPFLMVRPLLVLKATRYSTPGFKSRRFWTYAVLPTDTCFENSLLLFSYNSPLFYRKDLGNGFFPLGCSFNSWL